MATVAVNVAVLFGQEHFLTINPMAFQRSHIAIWNCMVNRRPSSADQNCRWQTYWYCLKASNDMILMWPLKWHEFSSFNLSPLCDRFCFVSTACVVNLLFSTSVSVSLSLFVSLTRLKLFLFIIVYFKWFPMAFQFTLIQLFTLFFIKKNSLYTLLFLCFEF